MPQPAGGRIARYLALAAVTLLLPLVSACAASYGAVTQEPYDPTNGVQADAGHIELRDVVAVAAKSGSATLVGSIINNGPRDDLVGIEVRGGRATLQPSPLPLPSHAVTRTGQPDALPPVVLSGRSVRLGLTTHLTFHFRRSPSVGMDVLVRPHEGEYARVPLPPSDQLRPGRSQS